MCDQNHIQTEHCSSLHLWKWRVYLCLQKYLHPKCNRKSKNSLTYWSTSTRACSFKMLWVVMVRWAVSAYVGVKCLNTAWLVPDCLVMPRMQYKRHPIENLVVTSVFPWSSLGRWLLLQAVAGCSTDYPLKTFSDSDRTVFLTARQCYCQAVKNIAERVVGSVVLFSEILILETCVFSRNISFFMLNLHQTVMGLFKSTLLLRKWIIVLLVEPHCSSQLTTCMFLISKWYNVFNRRWVDGKFTGHSCTGAFKSVSDDFNHMQSISISSLSVSELS